jgi:hypothetical protein
VTATIRVNPSSPRDTRLWSLTSQVTHILTGVPWVLIGGQMVAILEAEHGVRPRFTTGDVDALLDVRALADSTQEAANRLLAAGFEPEQHDGMVYRFVRGEAIVDILAPDNLGARADLRTVPPGSTVEAPGGRQALQRARAVTIEAGSGAFSLRVPSLTGAILIKARVAVAATAQRAKHERDLARLLALVAEPVVLSLELTRKERGYLRANAALADPFHAAWRGIAGAVEGAIALEIMFGG